MINSTKFSRYFRKLVTALVVFTMVAPAVSFAQEAPVIANLRVSEITDKTATIQWSTNLPAHGRVEFGLTGQYSSTVGFQGEPRISHTITLSNLGSETTYHFRVVATTLSAEASSFDQTFKTTKLIDRDTPVVTDVTIPYQGPNAAVVQWLTNEPADSLVLYGVTSSYGLQRGDGARVTAHDLTLTGLQPLTTYHFQVKSKDAANNVGISSNFTFRTSSSVGGTPPLDVTAVRPVSTNDAGVTDTTAEISWRTTTLSEGTVSWGPSDGLGRSVLTARPRNFSHSVKLTDLKPASTYYYQIEARDMFGARFRTGVYSFATAGGYVAPAPVASPIAPVGQVLGVSSAQDLLFYASFDGGFAADIAGGGATPILNGDPSIIDQGIRGKALNLPGHAHLTYPGAGNLALQQGTVLLWFKPMWEQSDGKLHILFDLNQYYKIPQDLTLSLVKYGTITKPGTEDLTNTIAWTVEDASGTAIHAYMPGERLGGHQWQFVAVTWAYHGGNVRLYLNGTSAGASFKTGAHNVNSPLGDLPPGLGGEFVVGSPRFDGAASAVDDLAIFGRVLSDNEIALIYAEGMGRYLPRSAGVLVPTSPVPTGQVLGASTLQYTPASALLKARGQPDVYAIMNGQQHLISGPSSFAAYGYRWSDVRVVDPEVLARYPYARLVRTPNDPTIYYLFQRPQQQWLKLALPSPTVFISYPENFWGNVITINEINMASYPEARLIKAADDETVYLLEGTTKRAITSDAVFDALHLPRSHVVTVNRVHLDFYPVGEPLQ